MPDEVTLDWIYAANALVIGAYLHLNRSRTGELVWPTADEEVDDRLAAYSLSQMLVERDILGPVASGRPDSLGSDRWPSWIKLIARSHDRSVSIRLQDLSYTDGHLAQLISETPEAILDVPISLLPPSRVLRRLNSLARLFLFTNIARCPEPERWGNEDPEDPFIQPSYRSKRDAKPGPKPGKEKGRHDQIMHELEALAVAFPNKRIRRDDVINTLRTFGVSASAARDIWRRAKLPAEWGSGGRIREADRISAQELVQRLVRKGIARQPIKS